MGVDFLENNELSAHPRSYGFRGEKPHNFNNFRSKAKGMTLDTDYSNFNLDFLKGKAYKDQQSNIDDYEKGVSGGQWEKDYPTKKAMSSCEVYTQTLSNLDDEIANLRRHATSDKAAFRGRWDKLSGDLQKWRGKFVTANLSLKCDQVRAEKDLQKQQQEINNILKITAAADSQGNKSGSKANLVLISVGAVSLLVLGTMLYFLFRKKPTV